MSKIFEHCIRVPYKDFVIARMEMAKTKVLIDELRNQMKINLKELL